MRAMQFRDLASQYEHLKPEIDAAVLGVLGSGNYIGGKHVRDLEERLADYVGVRNCVTCANGTDALQLSLMAWGIGEGSAVFVPDFTFFSSGEVVPVVGATPVFVDVDARTYNLDPIRLQEAIEYVCKNTNLTPRAVVSVDLYGLPADYPAIKEICAKNNLLLLEDGAQGFGGSIGNSRACSFGDISTTSFFPAKPLGCYGDGGAVFTNDDGAAEVIRSLAVHGKGVMKYDNIRIGMNSRLDAVQAAILKVKLNAFVASELSNVSNVARRYSENLREFAKERKIELPYIPDGYQSSWAQYTIQLPNDVDRQVLIEGLKDIDIPTMVYYPKPMHEQKAFFDECVLADDCHITEKLCERVLSLPIGPYLHVGDVDYVCESLEKLLR